VAAQGKPIWGRSFDTKPAPLKLGHRPLVAARD
jgi:hypothetical protein